MADETSKVQEVEFFFEYDSNYRIIAANGGWVGVTTRGDLRIDFVVEGQAIPKSIKNKFTPTEGMGEEIGRDPPARFSRTMQIGVLMSLDNAEVLADFIKVKIAEARKLMGKTK
jgi:hypothetical protein